MPTLLAREEWVVGSLGLADEDARQGVLVVTRCLRRGWDTDIPFPDNSADLHHGTSYAAGIRVFTDRRIGDDPRELLGAFGGEMCLEARVDTGQ